MAISEIPAPNINLLSLSNNLNTLINSIVNCLLNITKQIIGASSKNLNSDKTIVDNLQLSLSF